MRLRSFAKIWAQSRNIFECSDFLGHLCTTVQYNAMSLVIFPAESNVQQSLFGTDNRCTDVFLIFQSIINAT